MSTENIIGALKEKERSDDLHLRPKTKAFQLVRFSRQDHHSPQPKIILWTNRSHAPLTLPLKLLNQMHARHHFRSLSAALRQHHHGDLKSYLLHPLLL